MFKTTKNLMRLGVLVLALAAVACGGGGKNYGPGHDEVPTIIGPDEMNTFWVASLGVDEQQVVGANPSHDTLVQAHFSDFSEYQVQLASREEFADYPACMIYTSLPVTSGSPITLDVTRVTFAGLAGGDVELLPNEFGQLPTDLLPQRGFASESISLTVESDGGDASFPAFTDQIASPAQPILTQLGDAGADLAAGPSLGIAVERMDPFVVRWEPGGSDYVEIKLNPGAGTETPYAKLRCITFDDGGLEIPPEAMSYLALDQATNFKFRIEHHNFVLHRIEENGDLKAAALIDTSSTLEGTVLR